MVDALRALIRQNADETTDRSEKCSVTCLSKNNDVGDNSVLRLVTEIHNFFPRHTISRTTKLNYKRDSLKLKRVAQLNGVHWETKEDGQTTF